MLLVCILSHIIIGNAMADKLDFKLPSIYHIDDYDSCRGQNKLFCKANMVLSPKTKGKNEMWEHIQMMSEQRNFFNHSDLFHAICVNDSCPHKTFYPNQTLEQVISKCYTNRYENYDLKVTVTKIRCDNNENGFPIRNYDLLLIFFTIVYVIIVISATLKDYKNRHSVDDKVKGQKEKSWLLPFSVIANWKKMFKTNTDFEKLKCIQGIRFYNALLIILCHTCVSYIGGFVSNIEYIENTSKNTLKMLLVNSFTFLVSTFFLFSSFCMSHHHFQNMENGKFSSRTMLLSLLNRYLRIIPSLIVCVAFASSVWIYNIFHGPLREVYFDQQYRNCQKNWWASLVFINNHYDYKDICILSTWYLSADFQLYCLSLVILSFIWKFKQYTKQILILSLTIGTVIPMIVKYTYNVHYHLELTPENFKLDTMPLFTFNATYSSTYSNMATYMTGISFGLIYYKFKNKHIFTTRFRKFLWLSSFFGIPIMILFLTLFEYSTLLSVLLAGLLKPVFVTGIAIGVFGMSQGVGGIIRRICEWEFAVWMGNFTFCIYLVQYSLVLIRASKSKELLFISDYNLAVSCLCDIILSVFGGFLLHILVELPMRQIQSDRIPKERNRKSD